MKTRESKSGWRCTGAERTPNAFGATRRVHDGFTLVELMAVLAIVGIMTALIIPEIKGSYNDALLRASSRDLLSVCNLAWSQAIAANQAHRVRIDTHSGKYFVEKRVRDLRLGGYAAVRDLPGGDGAIDSRITIQVHSPGEELSEGSDVQTRPGGGEEAASEVLAAAITFYPDGTADPKEIVLRDPDGFRLALRINPVTARVRIEELERK